MARACAHVSSGFSCLRPCTARSSAWRAVLAASKPARCAGSSSDETTPTARDASSTCTVLPRYSGAIFTAVCCGLVVAPPISSGVVKPCRVISRATCTISSSDGVIRPLSPMMSASCSRAAARIFAAGTMIPRSTTS